ncbi:hypothetical protein [Tuwongella immobilis]|uniref:SUI1 domain-containing protein n=1 Tax=Tuwongella immobilis TaxID=692036 RepID=A0A6C2YJ99_9BACT|nr:hypothetical protein [Tuwongella immobilis]VIP01319.1 translation initiation factor sui1 : Translation initiation factor eIF-1 OS=Cellvibrio sp. BR GN=yciH PE=4 SV=1: LMWPc: SUI1 [Tuwongella immobilis]VTR98064.1 translation initiation factor sui1 : Translation initiation factor eIF-1 OS=Cellvibrio sp. BR GN=yciH PE=4 SV=1: LMWPc: SUI1 [Tuwongella immobilis]
MAKTPPKTLLFLGTGNHHRSRLAEILFNQIAGKFGLNWRAISRGIALDAEPGVKGPMAAKAVEALKKAGIVAMLDTARAPMTVTASELTAADHRILIHAPSQATLLRERFPEFTGEIESWSIEVTPELLTRLEAEITGLLTRMLNGGAMPEAPPEPPPAKPAKPAKKHIVKIRRETAGRRGKGVTVILDLPLNEHQMEQLATQLKNRCGTGGTVKDGTIEIQGDQRDKLTIELEKLGYQVKRAGG